MPFIYVHGLGLEKEPAKTRKVRHTFFTANINFRYRHRYRYHEVVWADVSRRPIVASLLGDVNVAHLGAPGDNNADYGDVLRQRIAGIASPRPQDLIDYMALEAASENSDQEDAEVAAARIVDIVDELASGNQPIPLSNSGEIALAARELTFAREGLTTLRAFSATDYITGKIAETLRLQKRNETDRQARPSLVGFISRFGSDAFAYLLTRSGNHLDSIINFVSSDIENTIRASRAGEPVFLLGHSFGGVILYDLLSSPNSSLVADSMSGRQVFLITAGSQVSMFHQIGFFLRQNGARPNDTVPPLPKGLTAWINVYDTKDILGFSLGHETERRNRPDLLEFKFDADANLVDSHSAYLVSETFWGRLGGRLGAWIA